MLACKRRRPFSGPRVRAWTGILVLAVLLCSLPAAAQGTQSTTDDATGSPTLSTKDRLDDRRYVVTGSQAYTVGTQAGRFPAMGFHTRGEMAGVWSPPLKLLDGIWFGIDDEWIGPADQFTSGYGYAKMDLPDRDGLEISRTDFVPDGSRAALFGLTFTAPDAEQNFTLKVDAHSELMNSYPWGETEPSQLDYNLRDQASTETGTLVFREQGTPEVKNAAEHDWAAVVGSALAPSGSETGEDFRGPQDPAKVCPPSPDEAPKRCDDTEYGKGRGGQLRYEINVPAGTTQTVWFAVAGSDKGYEAARGEFDAALADPDALLQQKVADRLALQDYTQLDIPGDRQLQESIDWSKQNLADAVQYVEDAEIRETNAGENYPPPEGTVDEMRFLGAGWPDYPWLFGTDGEYTVFASIAAGQYEPIKDHLRALRDVSLIDNGASGKVVHEVVYDGSVYFGSNADDGNTDESAKFPSAVAAIWRWTGDDAWLDEMYGFSRSNLKFIFRELDEDGDLWPEGLGNVEREGMGDEKLDNTVYTIRGLTDLADMAEYRGDIETAEWASERADAMAAKFEEAWWMENVPQHADSLKGKNDEKVQQRHWIGVTPMEVEFTNGPEITLGLPDKDQAEKALDLRREKCYSDDFGLFHTGGPGCDSAPDSPSEKQSFTLNTAIMAVAEGNYGRLGPEGQKRFTRANARLQLPDPENPGGEPVEMPGAMPEIAPSPMNDPTIDRPFNERPMVHQAWGAYGTLWPVVHQQLGVRPDLGNGRLEVTPQLPPNSSPMSGSNILLGDGTIDVSASAERGVYETTVTSGVSANLILGHTLPSGKEPSAVVLDGEPVSYDVRQTNRGSEILVDAGPATGQHSLIITTGDTQIPATGGLQPISIAGAAMLLAGLTIAVSAKLRRRPT